jgi:hypothetical protein
MAGSGAAGGSDSELAASGSTGPACTEAVQQLLAAQQELGQALEALPPVEGIGERTMYDAASLVQSQLEPARRVAALVEAFYQQPEQQAAAALELAQAAATRACANLRCPNVAGQGREEEGRLNKNKRCSACQAVRYCCRECSVVDWRAGHRRLCCALAEPAAAEAAAEEAVDDAAGEPAQQY